MKNYFFLFNLPLIFNINLSILEKSYFKLQNKIHPDRFILLSNKKKKNSLKFSIYINKAYYILKDPLKRSIYLCKLLNFNLYIKENKIIFSEEFLLRQLKLRDLLNNIKNFNNIKNLKILEKNILNKKQIIINLINYQFIKNNLKKIKKLIYNLLFLENLNKDIKNIFIKFYE